MNIYDAARPFRDAFNYDPGHSDLDNEQPITVHVTLGDWRRLNMALYDVPGFTLGPNAGDKWRCTHCGAAAEDQPSIPPQSMPDK